MILPVVEMKTEYEGYLCVCLFTPMGHRCGYVGVPRTHPCYGKHYLDTDAKCHGGLTYSEDYLQGFSSKDTWWFGFDCAHFMDNPDIEAVKMYFPNHPELVETRKKLLIPGNVVRKIDYVMEQCSVVAEWLKEWEDEK